VIFGAVALYAVIKLNRRLLAPTRLMLVGCVVAACAGLVVFDLWRGTYVVNNPRYAHAGFPAAILLAGIVIGRLPTRPRNVSLAVILLVSSIGAIRMYRNSCRLHDIRRATDVINQKATGDDLVIVSSIPSGVTGIARSMQSLTGESPAMAAWTVQFKHRKVPDDILRMARGRKRIFLVRIHEVWSDDAHEEWLWKNANYTKRIEFEDVRIGIFQPIGAERF
jgi:hypothetical protein